MQKWIRRVAVALLLTAIAGVIAYNQLWRPTTVEVFDIEPTALTVEVSGTGLLDAHLSAVVSTRIQGRIERLEVDQGDRVQAGQRICRLDDSDLQRQVEISEASVEVASAAISRAKAGLDRAGAALALAEREAQRIQNAAERGAVSASELDRVIQQAAIAAADSARADAALVEARKQLVVADRTLDFHRAQLAETVIVSPFDGIVVRRDRDPGDVVVPGSSIVRVVSTDELWVSAWVDEAAIASLAMGQPARIVFRSEPGREYDGRVARVGLEVDPETREFLMDIALAELPSSWAVGQRAEVYVVTEPLTEVIAVPGEYLFARDGQTGVFIVENGRARWRSCEVGARSRERLQVLSGLRAGERAIRPVDEAGGTALRPGVRVVAR